jgi:altronate hydrolase
MLQAVELTIRLHSEDDVVIARMELQTGMLIARENVRTAVTIPAGHKLAVRDIAQGKPVRRYDQIIGFATRDIKAGEHVHVHNLAMGDFQRDYAFCSLKKDTDFITPAATFEGIVRSDGRVATRNYIGILTSVNCSATVARMVHASHRPGLRSEPDQQPPFHAEPEAP